MYPQLQAGATQSLPQSCSPTVSGSAWAVGHRRFAPLAAVQRLLSVGIPWGWSSTANRAHHANGIVQPQWLLSLMMQRQSQCWLLGSAGRLWPGAHGHCLCCQRTLR